MYYTVKKNLKINGKEKTFNILHEGSSIPKNGKAFEGTPGDIGEPIEYYENGVRLSNDILVKEKLAESHIGEYYNEKGEYVFLNKINRIPAPNWRKDKPEQWERFDGEKWVEDSEKKEKILQARKKSEELQTFNEELLENLNLLNSTDHEIIKIYEEAIKENHLVKERKKARLMVVKLREDIKKIAP